MRVVVDVDDRFTAKSICEAKSEHFYSQGDSHLCRGHRRDCLFQIFFLAQTADDDHDHVPVHVIVDVRVVVDVDDRFTAKSTCEAKSEHVYSQGDSHLCRGRKT